MSQKFSPALRVGDLSDFISPSQQCVVSLKGRKPESKLPAQPGDSFFKPDPVKISLKDCLACSGCITSAETVMLEKQSLDEFLSKLNKAKAVIVSISPQSRASLAVHFGISSLQVFKKVTSFLKSLGVRAVFDSSCSRDLTLTETCNEFIHRYKHNLEGGSQVFLPMLTSACPGWICYAEKQLGSYILPYISSVKSPQQTIGAIIKHHTCYQMGLRPEEVYHVTVMPCYDKKLEAARDDFVFAVNSPDKSSDNLLLSEVDSVLTTGELLDLIKLKEVNFNSLQDSPLDRMLTNIDEEGHLYGVAGGSGGYTETVFRNTAKMVFGKELNGPLSFKTLRNSDFREVTLEVDGEVVLKFAQCYGFQNLLNIARKIRDKKCDYHFVEVMACPAGCLNGGGQIKMMPGQSPKEFLRSLESAYMENVLIANPYDNPIVKALHEQWLQNPGSKLAQEYLHTRYHAIVKSTAAQLHDW